MKKLKLIYNPNSGNKSFKLGLDSCVSTFQQNGYEVHLFRSIVYGDIDEHLAGMDKEYYDVIVISGGDGSINIVVNAMLKYGIDVPLGIIPSGTANDFATFLNMPMEPHKAAEVIAKGHMLKTDLGMVNGKYFINVCGAGFFTNISQKIDNDFKNTLGKMAYYIKGIEQLPNFESIPIRIKNSKETIDVRVYLYIVLNGGGTGGFEKLSPKARIDDGLLDFIAFKEMNVVDLAVLFVKVLRGEHLDDPNIIFFRDHYIEIESLDETKNNILCETDVDGETGPEMPVVIKAVKAAINVILP